MECHAPPVTTGAPAERIDLPSRGWKGEGKGVVRDKEEIAIASSRNVAAGSLKGSLDFAEVCTIARRDENSANGGISRIFAKREETK